MCSGSSENRRPSSTAAGSITSIGSSPYDASPYDGTSHHPLTNQRIDFGKTAEADFQRALFSSLRRKRKLALSLAIPHVSPSPLCMMVPVRPTATSRVPLHTMPRNLCSEYCRIPGCRRRPSRHLRRCYAESFPADPTTTNRVSFRATLRSHHPVPVSRASVHVVPSLLRTIVPRPISRGSPSSVDPGRRAVCSPPVDV